MDQPNSPPEISSPGAVRGFFGAIKRFRQEIRTPLVHSEGLSRFGRIKARVVHLFRKFGWKLFWAIFVFYLIRDVILYILIPYLVAKKIIDW